MTEKEWQWSHIDGEHQSSGYWSGSKACMKNQWEMQEVKYSGSETIEKARSTPYTW